jgi:hypothetical protein
MALLDWGSILKISSAFPSLTVQKSRRVTRFGFSVTLILLGFRPQFAGRGRSQVHSLLRYGFVLQ